MFRQLELAFCPNKEWEKKGALGQEERGKLKGRWGDWGGELGKQTREWGGVRRVLGKGKVQVEGVGRQNQRGAETRVKEDDWNFNNRSRKKRKSVKDERSSHFLWGQSKLGKLEKQRQEGPTISFHSSV